MERVARVVKPDQQVAAPRSAALGEARTLGPVFGKRGVAYRVAYGPSNGPIPAVLSVAMVRLGNRSVFQDRLNRSL